MFVGAAPYIEFERMELAQEGFILPEHWRELDSQPRTNLIHQLFHIYIWQKHTGGLVKNLEKIIEIGGGYGALARVIRGLGFEGEYVIYDLLEFTLLQKYYLSQFNVDAKALEGPPRGSEKTDLTIALYSLSEMSVNQQKKYFNRIMTDSWLFAANDAKWDGLDNRDLFRQLERETQRVPVPYPEGRYYLVK